MAGYHLTTKILTIAIVPLFCASLFLLFFHCYIRWFLRRVRPLVFSTYGQVHVPPAAAHGLDPEVLRSLPITVRSSAADAATAECIVCLSELEEGEKVRILPRCRHGFHVECIDMWLHSHATCPLCRSAVVAEWDRRIRPTWW